MGRVSPGTGPLSRRVLSFRVGASVFLERFHGAMPSSLLVLNGPNLNLLGTRDPETYGSTTLSEIETDLEAAFPAAALSFAQDNSEGALIDHLHAAHERALDGIVFNPGGYTHTSVAVRDAVDAIAPPVVEVHLSNVHARADFRRRSRIAPVCVGQISGLGPDGYHLAVRYLLERET